MPRAWVVDATADVGGSGDLDAPFNRLGEAERSSAPGDLIVVMSGEFEAGIKLKPRQHLVGRGAPLILPDGRQLPSGPVARISGGSKPGVVLGDGCVVRGLEIGGEPPILGRGVGSVTIEDVQTTGGVFLEAAHGQIWVSRVEARESSDYGLSVSSDGGPTFELTIRDSVFIGHRSAGIDVRVDKGGSVVIKDNTIDGNALGLVLTHAGGDGKLEAMIHGNRINGERGGSHTALQLFLAGESTEAAVFEVIAGGNTIGSGDLVNSGSQQGQGMEVYASGAGRLTAALTDNTIRAIGNGSALRLVSSTHTGVLDVTVSGNDCDVHPTTGFPLAGLELVVGTTAKDKALVRAELVNNIAFVGGSDAVGVMLTIAAGGSTIELAGYRGAANNQRAIEAFLRTAATTVEPSSRGFSTINAGAVIGRAKSSDQS